jgi:hypothetical protein
MMSIISCENSLSLQENPFSSDLALKRDGSPFSSLFAHDLFGKPLHTFPNHGLAKPATWIVGVLVPPLFHQCLKLSVVPVR